jgi:hypothetical protein
MGDLRNKFGKMEEGALKIIAVKTKQDLVSNKRDYRL